MKKKVYAALLLVAALVVAPLGQQLTGIVASATSNDSVTSATSNDSVTSATSNNSVVSAEERYVNSLIRKVTSAESGSTVRMKDVETLSASFITELAEKNDVTVVLEYTYEGVDYVVTIPAGGVINTGVAWYGPLYLAYLYGNDLDKPQVVETVQAVETVHAVYTVAAGDTLNRIAAANGMTLNELLAINPQITNANRIRVGQEINIY